MIIPRKTHYIHFSMDLPVGFSQESPSPWNFGIVLLQFFMDNSDFFGAQENLGSAGNPQLLGQMGFKEGTASSKMLKLRKNKIF